MNNSNPFDNNNFNMDSTIPASQNVGFDPSYEQKFDRPSAFYPTQPVYQPQPYSQQPVVNAESAEPSFKEWISSIIICACGISGIALGIASMVVANNEYGILNAAGNIPSEIQAGPSPVIALIMAFLALFLGLSAAVLGILSGNKAVSQGKPCGIGLTIGTACGIAAVIVCIFALSITSCTACSFKSIKDYSSGSNNIF